MTDTEKVTVLRMALIGLVGVDSKSDLEVMEGVLRSLPYDESQVPTLNAVRALLATLDEP